MLQPKKTKYRRQQDGHPQGIAQRGNQLAFGSFGIKSLGTIWVTGQQIEAARVAVTRYMQRQGQIWIRIFPHIPVTKKPLDVKMGSGKGEPQFHVAKVKAGTVMFEIAGVTEAQAREALRLASHKLPVRCRIVKKEEQ